MSPVVEWAGQVLGPELVWVRDLVLVSGLVWGFVLLALEPPQESESELGLGSKSAWDSGWDSEL